MSDKWEDAGGNPYGLNILEEAMDAVAGIDRVQVVNTETGEYRDVEVYSREGQTLGEAIANGQFREEK